MSKKLGEFLRLARERANKTQVQAAEYLSERLPPKKISQGLLAQYENGRIVFPDASILRALARLYKVDYSELVFRVGLDVISRYELADEGPIPDLDAKRLHLWEESLNRFPTVGNVEGMEGDLLDSKASFVGQYEILNIKAISKWQKLIDPLTEFWVITPYFLDDNDPCVLDAVLHNLSRNVQYVYFVRDADIKKGGRFHVLMSTITRLATELERPMSEQLISELIKPVGIDEDDLKWINTDVVIANPFTKDAVGFASIRNQGLPVYGYRLGEKDVAMIVARMDSYAREMAGDNVRSIFRAPAKSKSRSKK